MKEKHKQLLLSLFVLLVGSFLFTRPPIDADFGWHYKYGEYIWENRIIPRENLFSFTLPDYQWSNSYWLAEVVLYLLFHNLGFFLASLLLGLALMLTLHTTVLSKLSLPEKLVLTAILAYILDFFIVTVRPLYFSTSFMFVLIWVLFQKKAYIKYLPVMFLFWANLHPGFLPGLFVLGLYTLEQMYTIWRSRDVKPVKFISILLPLLLSALATLINPYTYDLWLTLLNEANNVQFATIYEHMPMIYVENSGIYIFFHFMVGLILASAYWQRKSVPRWYLATLIFFFILATKSSYFYRVFFIIGTFALTEGLLHLGHKIKELKLDLGFLSAPFKLIFPVMAGLLFLISIENLFNVLTPQIWLHKHKIPYGAVSYVKQNPLPGRMLNVYDWGGYLIWQLPEYKTFIDGRMASWKISPDRFLLEDYRGLFFFPQKNPQLVERYIAENNLNWAILRKDSKLQNFLINNLGWQETYSDSYSSVLIAPN